ncbi:hypothetical protein [Izhakiella australiensis]|nr:hypothetical protein [Izhakiella australiensis]
MKKPDLTSRAFLRPSDDISAESLALFLFSGFYAGIPENSVIKAKD